MSLVAGDRLHVRVDTGVGEFTAGAEVARVLVDTGLLAQRNLLKTSRNVRWVLFATIQPALQLVLFSLVFGAIVDIPDYRNLIVPTVLIQAVTFSAMSSGVGIANDLNSGMVERLRSLPVARSAYLLARVVADGVRLALQASFLVVFAYVTGFRFGNGLVFGLASVVAVVVFGVALASFAMWLGFLIRDAEVVQAATFVPLLPLLFTSSAFSPVGSLPDVMRPIAAWNPVTAAVDTARGLALGDEALVVFGSPSLSASAVRLAVWCVVIAGSFTALAVRRYRHG